MPHRNWCLLFPILAVALGGCTWLPGLTHWAQLGPRPGPKITAVPVDLPPRSPTAVEDDLYAHAVAAIDRRDYAQALDLLQVAREARADDPRLLTAMGVVYDKLARFDLSKRYYDLAEKADPGSKVVARDRAYSQVLQQRIDAPATAPVVLLAEAPPPVIRIGAPLNLAAAAPAAHSSGHPVHIRNATGRPGAGAAVGSRLAAMGWQVARGANEARNPVPISRLQFPPGAEHQASGLARSLAFPVKLDSCPNCTRVELVLGTDFLAKSGQPTAVRRD